MNYSFLLLYVFLFTTILLVIQRAEAKSRIFVALCLVLTAELGRRYAVYRDVEREAIVGFVIALVLNVTFWLLIGRYNPVGSSDDIQVLGMDD